MKAQPIRPAFGGLQRMVTGDAEVVAVAHADDGNAGRARLLDGAVHGALRGDVAEAPGGVEQGE